ncbi:hypothetical protein PIROE2DRAFT_4801 [Piromyces sp. E2]|nr:hypothetical protein PIROE2DRAFT_4801 [Piromyces sp. E2]|eukprot:OUM67726.1 hypothetical protein PIROE2DRAFT_4801 [Piromyces sp. E2]
MELKVLTEFSPFGEHILKERQKSFINKNPIILKSESSSKDSFEPFNTEISSEDISKIYQKGKYTLNSPNGILNSPFNESKDVHLNISYDEELYIFGSKVIWSQGNVLKRSYSFESYNQQVKQAFWAYFYVEDIENKTSLKGKENKVLKKTLCIFLQTFAKFYLQNGQSFTLNLPFKIKEAFPLDHGIIIQRMPEKEELLENSIKLSVLFSVMHPLEEMRIVSIYHKSTQENYENFLSGNMDNNNIVYFTKVHDDVIYTSTNRKIPIIVTFDKTKKVHQIWRYHNHPLIEFKCDGNDNFDVDYDNEEFLEQLKKRQIISILFLEKVWTEEEQVSENQPADRVFIVNSKSESDVLCFFQKSKQLITGISIGNMLKHKKIKKVFTIDALSAQPIRSLRYPLYDMLILSPDNELYLWTGTYDERLKCIMPEDYQGEINRKNEQYSGKRRRNNSATSDDDLNSIHRNKSWLPPSFYSSELKIVDIIDPVDNKINIVYSNGTVVRTLLDIVIYSYLVRSCVKALSISLPYHEYYEILIHLIMASFGGPSHPLYQEEEEWDIFVIIMLAFCFPSVNKYRKKQIASEKINEIKNSSFESMIISSYHRSNKKQPYMKLFTKTAIDEEKMKENDLEQNSKSKNNTIKPTPLTSQFYKYYLLYEKAKIFHSKIKDHIDLTQRLPIILYTLHLVYEDLKLNILNRKYIRSLGYFLCHLACCIEWQNYYEYYLRDGINFQKKLYKLKCK